MSDRVSVGTRPPHGPHRARAAALAVALLLAAATGCASEDRPRVDSTPATAPADDHATEVPAGWIAFAPGWPHSDITLVRAGETAHRIFGSDDDDVARICPAFAPDGALVFGEATGTDEAGWVDAAVLIADVTADGEASVVKRIGLDDLDHAPCPILSPDGRLAAFGAEVHRGLSTKVADAVWVLDTATGDLRRLTGLSATDLEWAPDGSELYIAGEGGIVAYSLADARTRTLDDTALAETLSASPDGRTLAVERRKINAADRYDLWLMNTDGSDPRALVSDYAKMHGIGPVWSPDGNHVVFQRSCETITYSTGEEGTCSEEHDVVLVTVTDDDPAGPVGTQTLIPRPQTGEGDASMPWFPFTVTWSPDSTMLLYLAWSSDPYQPEYSDGLLVVPASGSTPPVVLYESDEPLNVYAGFPRNTFQSWSG